MKSVFLFLLFGVNAFANEEKSNPLGKVLELLDSLEAKVKAEGEAEDKSFKAFFAWCDDTSKNINYEIKTASEKADKLQAQVEELSSDTVVGTSKIEDISSATATAEKELKEAAAIRSKEAADFEASEKELVATVDTLQRATTILEKTMASGGAALAQIDTTNLENLVQSLSVVIDAAAFSSSDRTKLLELVQSRQTEDADDDELGAPAAATYESHSGSVVEVLEDLKEKAEGELSDSRKAEASARDNHAMLKQSLEDKLKADSKDMDDEKAGVSEAKEGRAVAEGDLAVTMKDLKNSKASLATANSDCMRTAADHEATVAARTEELKVVAKTKKILQDSTGGAETQTYSLLQVTSSSKTRAALANSQVLEMVKTLAQKQHSAALSQLASRISAVVRYSGSAEANPFEKVKGLITDMLSKLQREADSEATEKAYCDEQMSKTEAKKAELEDDIEQLTSKIDKAAARSAELKEEVAELQSELGALQKAQAEMDAVRQASHANYAKAKTELTAGLEGVRKALGVLREYYGGGVAAAAMLQDDEKFGEFMQQPAPPQQHEKSAGAGGGIISMLEICESDFAINLAKEETEEADAADAYDRMTQENKVSKTGKEQDVSYKTKEAISLDKGISDISGDRNSAQTEQSAVLEYYAKIKERCVAKPDSYESLKSRREAEVQGLREALSVLENEASFLQRRHRRGVRFMQVQ